TLSLLSSTRVLSSAGFNLFSEL
ncbi:uncharacterized protein METZ01_LOCUS505246, partial [marine metagenome]